MGRAGSTGRWRRAGSRARRSSRFVWLAALEHGMHPGDRVQDAPLQIGLWRPQNFDGKYRGEVTLEEALAQSLNTVAVRLLQAAGGPSAAIEVARRLGIGDALPADLSLALGTGEVGLLELSGAYAALVNGGFAVQPSGIEVASLRGRSVVAGMAAPARVIDPALAADMKRCWKRW